LPKEELLQKARPGFSLFELIVVVFIIGLLAAVAIPSLKEVLPNSRLNAETQRLSAFLRQARLRAANTQKAVRVSINCMNHVYDFSRPCRALMETAVYEGGIFDGWMQLRDGRVELNNAVNVKAADNAWSPTKGSDINDDLIWLIFTPSTRVMTSFGPPVNITMWYGDVPLGGRAYELTLNQASGRVTVAQATR
jgi:type II secretion system protein H